MAGLVMTHMPVIGFCISFPVHGGGIDDEKSGLTLSNCRRQLRRVSPTNGSKSSGLKDARRIPQKNLRRSVVALKVETVAGPLLTVTLREVGLKVIPGSLGVTVYVPGATFVKLYLPLAAVVTAMVVPFWLRVTVAPLPSDAGVMVPETVYVAAAVAVKVKTVAGPPLTVTFWEAGVKLIPGSFGVTVYVPGATPVKL
jgi:hypothetical protein